MPAPAPSRIVTLDGPAGSGKSTVARLLAQALGYVHLDSGALYRAITSHLMRDRVPLEDPDAIDRAVSRLRLEIRPREGGTVPVLDGVEAGPEIRTPEVTRAIASVADRPAVRACVDHAQRAFAREHPVVAEGRDEGSEVFPDAPWKFYLDASVDARAQRRLQDFRRQGRSVPIEEVARDVRERDARDRARPRGALRIPPGAERIDTSDLPPPEVVSRLRARIATRPPGTGR